VFEVSAHITARGQQDFV